MSRRRNLGIAALATGAAGAAIGTAIAMERRAVGRERAKPDPYAGEPLGTLHTEPCEQVFRGHPQVTRCALIGLGVRPEQRPAIVVETRMRDTAGLRALAGALRGLAVGHAHTARITRFYFRARFPVDVRHNAKIHRLTLARWAETARPYDTD